MKNKALFYGSSFTWGNGLWLFDFDGYHKNYFNLPEWDWKDVIQAQSDIYDSILERIIDYYVSKLPSIVIEMADAKKPFHTIHKCNGVLPQAREFMLNNRWSKLVSNHYGMEELNNANGHGLIFKTVLLMSEEKRWENIGLLSIEFFGVARFQDGPINENGGEGPGPLTPKEMEMYIKENPNDYYSERMEEWIINFDYDFQLKTQLQRLEEQLEKISKFNIPTVIHFWQEDDIQEMRKLILDYPLVYKYTMNKDVAILDWAEGRYKIHDEHSYYNRNIGKEDLHLGLKGHKEFSKRIIEYIGDTIKVK